MPAVTDPDDVEASHSVCFYGSDEELLGVIGDRLVRAVATGDAAVVIATASHEAAIRAACAGAGVDVAAAEADDRLLFLDAADTLASFSVDGAHDPAAFEEVIGGAIRRASAGDRRVHAFGEMVALLWAAGDVLAAIDLEGRWNDLCERVPMSLLCGYPLGVDDDLRATDRFVDVCGLHAEVVGAAPVPEGFDAVRRFARTTLSPGLARQFVTETLQGWGLDHDLAVDAEVVVAELVTNAVVHARSDVTVALRREDGGVRMAVGDGAPRSPEPREAGPHELGGRGLRLVDGICGDWGHEPLGTGKVVWARLGAVGAGGAGLG